MTSKPATRRRNAKSPTKGRAARIPPGAEETGEKAAAAAKAKNAVGASVTIAQRQLRDSAVVARSAAGWSSAMIAEEYEITDRQVRRILADRAAMPSGRGEKPMALYEEIARGFRASIADFEAMGHRYRDDHPNVALGAKRAAVDARDRYANVMAIVGQLPTNMSLFRGESELRRIADEIVATMLNFEAGEITAFTAQTIFESIASGNGPPELGAGT